MAESQDHVQEGVLGRVDVLIGGAGFAGLALALALRQAVGPAFAVAGPDTALGREGADGRATRSPRSAHRLVSAIGGGDAVAAPAEPMLDMVITDSKLDDAVRPTFLTFAGDVRPGEPFAHMVENRDV